MGFLSLFGLKLFDPDTFEKELSSIAQEISRTRNKMTVLGKRRRTSRKNIISYPVIIYTSWVIYRYNVALNNLGSLSVGHSRLAIFFRGQLTHELIRIAAIPVLIAMLAFLVNWFFLYLIESQNKRLNLLVKKHKTKIEELKKLSNYNTTNQLLEKYGDKSTKPGKVKNEKPQPLAKATKQNQAREQRNVPNLINSKRVEQPPRPVTVGTPTKSIQDRVLDYIIGSDHNENIESRYALICANCYTHNGLAPPGSTNPLETTYICRNCGFINGLLNLKKGTHSPLEKPTLPNETNLPIRGESVLDEPAVRESVLSEPVQRKTEEVGRIGSEAEEDDA